MFNYRKTPEYFRLRLFCEDSVAVNAASPAIIAVEPHDILPVGIFTFSEFLGYFPKHTLRSCMSSACFILPGMRQIYTWTMAQDADKNTLHKILKKKESPGICPGGAFEVICFLFENCGYFYCCFTIRLLTW